MRRNIRNVKEYLHLESIHMGVRIDLEVYEQEHLTQNFPFFSFAPRNQITILKSLPMEQTASPWLTRFELFAWHQCFK